MIGPAAHQLTGTRNRHEGRSSQPWLVGAFCFGLFFSPPFLSIGCNFFPLSAGRYLRSGNTRRPPHDHISRHPPHFDMRA